MPTIDIDPSDLDPDGTNVINIDIYCGTCGAGLCRTSSADTNRSGGHRITVNACETCVQSARDEGYGEGWDDGQEDADDS
jgi:hypothetical protein